MRLFAVKDVKTGDTDHGIADAPEFFATKPAAKKIRDAINEAGGNACVTPGPDHWKISLNDGGGDAGN